MNRAGGWLAGISVAETVSFIALLAAMLSGSEVGVSLVGTVHGLLFLGYVALVLLMRETLGWSWIFSVVVIVTGPVGAVIALERLRRQWLKPTPQTAAPPTGRGRLPMDDGVTQGKRRRPE